ncbi:hypothetical protein EI94DRAFT_1727893 [Lactarius quietus]|nr:hypothetical protein EI94DRAFT_1727893 [Lactarius quietus]
MLSRCTARILRKSADHHENKEGVGPSASAPNVPFPSRPPQNQPACSLAVEMPLK